MVKYVYWIVAWILIGGSVLLEGKIGSVTRTFYDQGRSRPLITTLWFPEPFEKGKLYPLMVFSHNREGSRLELAWIAEYFAEKGYITAAVDHYGDCNYLKLPENKDALWDRALDLSQLMFFLTTDSQFGPHFKQDRAIVVGYSAGALAALWLGGARASKYPQKEGTASYKDNRVRAIILLAPGFGSYFEKEGLTAVKIPTLVLGVEGDTFYPLATNAMFFSKFIPNAQYLKVARNAPHDIFICPDRIQKNKILKTISEFLIKNIK